jgi:spore coat polysaccharide biosynthesis protein SpsF (cytidylyltransferase family)
VGYGEQSGLPYGVSVELTYLKHLRESILLARDEFDREHVTPIIRRKFGVAYFEKYKFLEKAFFRCTIDCLEDYLSLICTSLLRAELRTGVFMWHLMPPRVLGVI